MKILLKWLKEFLQILQWFRAISIKWDKKHEGLSEYKIIKIQDLKFLILHGHQIAPWNDPIEIERLRRNYDVDIVVCGHIPESKIMSLQKGLYLNPGSITGIQIGEYNEKKVASFALIKLGKNWKGMVYFYKYD